MKHTEEGGAGERCTNTTTPTTLTRTPKMPVNVECAWKAEPSHFNTSLSPDALQLLSPVRVVQERKEHSTHEHKSSGEEREGGTLETKEGGCFPTKRREGKDRREKERNRRNALTSSVATKNQVGVTIKLEGSQTNETSISQLLHHTEGPSTVLNHCRLDH